MPPTERWLPVPDFGDAFEVSSEGRVRRLVSRNSGRAGHCLKPGDARGYAMVVLRHEGREKAWLVHRLVLTVFRGAPPHPRAQARHLNGQKRDNRLANLAWGSPKQNAADKKRHGTAAGWKSKARGGRHYRAKLTANDVRAIRASSEPAATLAKRYKVTASAIGKIRRRVTWRHVE